MKNRAAQHGGAWPSAPFHACNGVSDRTSSTNVCSKKSTTWYNVLHQRHTTVVRRMASGGRCGVSGAHGTPQAARGSKLVAWTMQGVGPAIRAVSGATSERGGGRGATNARSEAADQHEDVDQRPATTLGMWGGGVNFVRPSPCGWRAAVERRRGWREGARQRATVPEMSRAGLSLPAELVGHVYRPSSPEDRQGTHRQPVLERMHEHSRIVPLARDHAHAAAQRAFVVRGTGRIPLRGCDRLASQWRGRLEHFVGGA